ncbi:hypothetical protein GCM10010284_04290 [Streptomyces rubiginosohelvolus]|uniref:Uncharacterized protein n=1 Tax=Streptomyces rubiginosohelvolus TaxID=67362 RepID=A0ABQ3BEK3_9ACTN|nr:hypothetical protein GCM10010284_04290 [Streptomyces rubiginosohelvolus]GGZ38730.1 hypothetical protein GCM10010328_10730 [Streptomyces pluricolorescens]
MSHPLYENLPKEIPTKGVRARGPRNRGRNTHRVPGRRPALLPGRFPYVRPYRADEYCGTRFRSSRREARSIDTQPSNLVSVPYGARAWPIESGILPRASV